jgi:integrase
MGLGPYPLIGISQARQRAQDARRLLVDKIDPLEQRDRERNARRLDAAKSTTFKDAAEAYIKSHRAGWRNEKHAAQWDSTLAAYAYPKIGALAVQAVDTALVLKVLEPIWTAKSETASRVRQRLEAILDYAKVRGYCVGENPARWRGHLDKLLPKPGKVRGVKHHSALPWQQIGAFMSQLQAQGGMAALALRFAILCACRTGEVLGARWSEINIKAALWIVPPERVKSHREHRVPLSEEALAVLREAAKFRDGDSPFVFLGTRKGAPLSNMSLLMTLRRMSRDDLTAHGFRSSFRDWAAETGRPAEIAEAALAHVVGDKTIEAYQRSDLLESRRRLMADWAKFCSTPFTEDSNVVALKQGAPA